jgi:hypothetical protein
MSDSYQLETFVKGSQAGRTKHLPPPGNGDPVRRTTTKCRDTDKQLAIGVMEDVAQRCGVSALAVRDAVELFAASRNQLERMMHKNLFGVACLYVCHTSQKRRAVLDQVADVSKSDNEDLCMKKRSRDSSNADRKRRRHVSPMNHMSMYIPL